MTYAEEMKKHMLDVGSNTEVEIDDFSLLLKKLKSLVVVYQTSSTMKQSRHMTR